MQELSNLLSDRQFSVWRELVGKIDSLYDMERIWGKGFGDWKCEYKYRRGGKTLCTLYAKKDAANILIILGKAERDKFEAVSGSFSAPIRELYRSTESFHDGKWLWIPLDENLVLDDIIAMLKIKRRPNKK